MDLPSRTPWRKLVVQPRIKLRRGAQEFLTKGLSNELTLVGPNATSAGLVYEAKHAAIPVKGLIPYDDKMLRCSLWQQCRAMKDDRMCKEFLKTGEGTFTLKLYDEANPKGGDAVTWYFAPESHDSIAKRAYRPQSIVYSPEL